MTVRTTSVLCLLGLGLGFGSILVYQLCSRLFSQTRSVPPVSPVNPRRRRSSQISQEDLIEDLVEKRCISLQTPSDSVISTASHVIMGNHLNPDGFMIDDRPVHYSPTTGVRFRGQFQQDADTCPRPGSPPDQGYLEQPLSINIPGEVSSRNYYKMRSSTTSEDPALTEHFRNARHTSEDQISLIPNFSPNSLYEKNFNYHDFDNRIISQSPEDVSKDAFYNNRDIISASGAQCELQENARVNSLDVLLEQCPVSQIQDTHMSTDAGVARGNQYSRGGDGGATHVGNPPPSPNQADRLSMADTMSRLGLSMEDRISRVEPPMPMEDAGSPTEDMQGSPWMSLDHSISVTSEDWLGSSLDASDASGVATPDASISVGHTATDMEQLEGEVADVMRDLEELTDKVSRLQGGSSDAELQLTQSAPSSTQLRTALQVLRRHKARDGKAMLRSYSTSEAETLQPAHMGRKAWRKTYPYWGATSLYEDEPSNELSESYRSLPDGQLDGYWKSVDTTDGAAESYRSQPDGQSDSQWQSVDGCTSQMEVAVSLKGGHSMEDSDVQPGILAVGERQDVMEYAAREWKSSTPKATKIKKGYGSLEERTGCSHLRRIRGDNFCAVRAVVFQALRQALPVLSHWGSYEHICQQLEHLIKDHEYLHGWDFASRAPQADQDLFERALSCVKCLQEQVEAAAQVPSEQREEHIAALLNSNRDLDLRLMDAVKVLMMAAAIELYELNTRGEDVPTFSWLLYARETSMTPADFYQNHLKLLGSQAGLEQVEMFLLSYTLEVSIDVARLAYFNKDDFLTTFCYDTSQSLPSVQLVAEDDRHYNVLV